MNKPYYHGSARKILDDYLKPNEQWNSVQKKRVRGAFVTDDANYAKFFALNGCISGRGQVRLENKKIYLERLADKIKPYFYVYTVYETPDSAFIHDKGTEYYCENPIKIAEVQQYDTVAELANQGYEVYVLDEPFNAKDSSPGHRNDNSIRQNYMTAAIERGQYHRVDIEKLLREQKKQTFKNAAHSFKAKVLNLLNGLRNTGHGNN